MFFVYGTSGQLFRGSMEQLRQIHGVGSLARVRRPEAVGRDGRDVAEQQDSTFSALPLPAHKDEPTHLSPVAAYTQTQKTTPSRRQLSTVDDVMSRKVITLPDSSRVLDGWQLLTEKAVGQVPVVDAAGHLVGLLSRADLLKPMRLHTPEPQALAWPTLLHQSVKNIMLTPVPSVGPEADLRRVSRVLLDMGLPGLPVVDEQGSVTGFVSRSDILRAVVTDPPLDLWG
ncbi:MAG: hypothetical protein FD135_463 [Comamonadaceae bacterium]|nr:MAG: hypothetical protein FD135_463 [Comamonadaceae bacterium]